MFRKISREPSSALLGLPGQSVDADPRVETATVGYNPGITKNIKMGAYDRVSLGILYKLGPRLGGKETSRFGAPWAPGALGFGAHGLWGTWALGPTAHHQLCSASLNQSPTGVRNGLALTFT